MGAFVLGVLIGWLAEWLFFTFWVKGNENDNSEDCTSVRTELMEKLDAKNSEIAVLKAELKDQSEKSNTVTESNNDQVVTKKKVKKVSVNKPAVKKDKVANTTKDTASIKKATKIVPRKKSVKAQSGDDFTKLTGIGPSMAAKLKGIGITTYQKLAAMDDDNLREMLEASGARLNNNKDAMDSWNEQATLAAKGDFEGLKKFQGALKK